MANFKAGVNNGGVSGKSQWFPQEPAFKSTFWSGSWGSNGGEGKTGSMEKGGKMMGKKAMGSKSGKCAFC